MTGFALITLVVCEVLGLVRGDAGLGTFLPAGGFHLSFKGAEKCPQKSTEELHFDIRIRRITRNELVHDGNWRFKRNLDDKSVSLRMKFDRWGNGGWIQNNFMYNRDNGCSGWKSFVGPDVWKEYSVKAGFKDCPILQGNYTYQGFRNSLFDSVNVPGLFTGRYKITVSFIDRQSKKLLGCFQAFYECLPKKPN